MAVPPVPLETELETTANEESALICTDSGTTNLQPESSVDVAKADQICEAEVTRLEKCPTEIAAKLDRLEKCLTDVITTDGTSEAEKEINQLEKCPADAAKPDGLEKCPADVVKTDETCEAESEDTKLEKPSPPTGLVAKQPTVTSLSESTPILNPCDQSGGHVEESASHKLPTVESKAEEDALHNKESESNNETSANVISCDQLDEHMESNQQSTVESKAKEQDADEPPRDAKSEVSEKEDSESSEEDVLLDYPAVHQDMSKLVLSTEFSHEDLDPDHEGAEEDSVIPYQNLFKQQSDKDTPIDLHSDHGTSNLCVENVSRSSFSACSRQGDIESVEHDQTLPNQKSALENNNVETLDCEGEAVELMEEGDSGSVGHDLPTSDLHSSRSKLGELLRNLPIPTSEVQEEDEDLEKSDIRSELEKCTSNQDTPKVFMCGEFLSLDGDGEMQVGYPPSSQEESTRCTKRKTKKQTQKQKQRKLQGATPKKSPTRKPSPKKANKEVVPGPGGELSSSKAAHTDIVVPPDLDYEASKVPLKPRRSLRKKKKKIKKPSLESNFSPVVTEILPEANHGELTAPKPEIASSQASSSVWQTSSNTAEAIHLSEASIRKKGKRAKRKGHSIEDTSMISKPKKRKKTHLEKEMVPCEGSLTDLLVDTSKVAVIDLSKEPSSRGTMKTVKKGQGSRKRKGWCFPSEVCAICHVEPHLYIWI